MMCRITSIVICGFMSASAEAQTTDTTTHELIQSLLTRIDTLEKRVAELEHERSAAVPHPALPAPAAAAGEATHAQHERALIEGAQPSYPSLKLSGFSDFDFSGTDLHTPAGGFSQQTLLRPQSGFEEGQFILHFSSALSPRVNFFGELSFTARPDAGQGSPAATGFNAEVERAIIRFDQSDRLKVSFGRYHTPINYWNTAFHHGQWLQTTISRPEMTQFGGSFIPVHFIGALAEGVLPAGGLNLNYNIGVGNGRGSVISRGGDFGDINNNRAWLANLFIRPNSVYPLQVGGSVYRDEVTPLTGPAVREWIQSGHIVWHKENPEFIAEFANVSHRAIFSSVTSNSQAWYMQTAFRLPWNGRAWKPYYRFEYTHVPNSDTLFRAVPTFNASTAGIRYDLTSFAALKFEFRKYNRRNLPDIIGAFTQVSFTF
jgi:hypothetical protein